MVAMPPRPIGSCSSYRSPRTSSSIRLRHPRAHCSAVSATIRHPASRAGLQYVVMALPGRHLLYQEGMPTLLCLCPHVKPRRLPGLCQLAARARAASLVVGRGAWPPAPFGTQCITCAWRVPCLPTLTVHASVEFPGEAVCDADHTGVSPTGTVEHHMYRGCASASELERTPNDSYTC